MTLIIGEIRVRRGTSTEWTEMNPVLGPGEPGYETDTRKVKFGDGSTPWAGLGYLTPVLAGGGDGGTDDEALLAHINAAEPHPVYDVSIPSLAQIFENGLI